MMAMLHSNGQLRTERDGDTEKGCQNLLYSRRLLMMMMINCTAEHTNNAKLIGINYPHIVCLIIIIIVIIIIMGWRPHPRA